MNSTKNIDSKSILLPRTTFGPEMFLGLKKLNAPRKVRTIWPQFWCDKNFGSQKNLSSQNLLVWKISLVWKKCWLLKFLAWKIFWVPKIYFGVGSYCFNYTHQVLHLSFCAIIWVPSLSCYKTLYSWTICCLDLQGLFFG